MEIQRFASLRQPLGLSLVRNPRAEPPTTGQPPPRLAAALPPPGGAAAENDGLADAALVRNAQPQSTSASLRFEIDRVNERVIATLVDDETGGIIRQYTAAQLVGLTRNAGAPRGTLLEAIA